VDLSAPALPRYAEPRVPWRRTAVIASVIAAVELLALVVVALAFVAKPFADDADAKPKTAAAGTTGSAESAAPAGSREVQRPTAAARPVVVAELPRAKTPVLVLNGNGIAGAASATALRVKALRYPVAGVGDASRRDFPRTIVMFRPGYQGEAERLARDLDLGANRAIPLDGMRPADLGRAKLVLILGS
jgi:hypothetical protein